MAPETDRKSPAQIASVIGASLYGVVITTGALTLVLVLAAAMNGNSVADLFAEVFPRFRGGPYTSRIPGLGYAIFIIYVVAGSAIAFAKRRRFARKWSRRVE